MLLIILVATYFFIGGLLAAALLTDRNINTNRLEALFSVTVGILWPLAVSVAAGFAFFENIQEKLRARKQAKTEQMRQFCSKLYKLNLISRDTLRGIK
jgi:hypothetical protein